MIQWNGFERDQPEEIKLCASTSNESLSGLESTYRLFFKFLDPDPWNELHVLYSRKQLEHEPVVLAFGQMERQVHHLTELFFLKCPIFVHFVSEYHYWYVFEFWHH